MSRIVQNAIESAQEAQIEDVKETEDAAETDTDAVGDFVDRRFDPNWMPTASERREMLLAALRAEISQHVRLPADMENNFWDRFRYDDATMTIEVRPEFRDAPGAVSFRFDEQGGLRDITGPGAEDLTPIRNVEITPETPDESPFAIPDLLAPPQPKRY